MVVLLGVVGQLALKRALAPSPARSGLQAYVSLGMLTWLVCYAISTILWLVVLRTVPLSQAFPILGAQFALIPIAARQVLNEEVAPMQWLGITIIVVGVALVGQS